MHAFLNVKLRLAALFAVAALGFVACPAPEDPSNMTTTTTTTTTTPSTTTTPMGDTDPPEIVSVTPADTTSDVALDAVIVIEFNETMNPALGAVSISSAADGVVAATDAWAPSNQTLTITPDASFRENDTISVLIADSFQDAAGNQLADSTTIAFTTESIAPTVTNFLPVDGAFRQPTAEIVQITFSEAMDTTVGTFTLEDSGGAPVATTEAWMVNDTVLTLTPDADLARCETFTVTVGTDATDAAGVALAAEVTWSFETEKLPFPFGVGNRGLLYEEDMVGSDDLIHLVNLDTNQVLDTVMLTNHDFIGHFAVNPAGTEVAIGAVQEAAELMNVFIVDITGGMLNVTFAGGPDATLSLSPITLPGMHDLFEYLPNGELIGIDGANVVYLPSLDPAVDAPPGDPMLDNTYVLMGLDVAEASPLVSFYYLNLDSNSATNALTLNSYLAVGDLTGHTMGTASVTPTTRLLYTQTQPPSGFAPPLITYNYTNAVAAFSPVLNADGTSVAFAEHTIGSFELVLDVTSPIDPDYSVNLMTQALNAPVTIPTASLGGTPSIQALPGGAGNWVPVAWGPYGAIVLDEYVTPVDYQTLGDPDGAGFVMSGGAAVDLTAATFCAGSQTYGGNPIDGVDNLGLFWQVTDFTFPAGTDWLFPYTWE